MARHGQHTALVQTSEEEHGFCEFEDLALVIVEQGHRIIVIEGVPGQVLNRDRRDDAAERALAAVNRIEVVELNATLKAAMPIQAFGLD